MDATFSRLLESHFGPESELIDIQNTILEVVKEKDACALQLAHRWDGIPEDRKTALASECSIRDLKSSLQETWADPTMSSYLLQEQDRIAQALSLGTVKEGRATRRGQLSAPDALPPEIRALHGSLNSTRLSSWTYPTEAVAFVRTPRNYDQNAYDTLKPNVSSRARSITSEQEAILIITVFDKVPWSPCYVTRLSQHAFLASQTLGELCRAIPCVPYASRVPSQSNPAAHSYATEEDSDSVICIEGEAFGNGGADDYATKLVEHISTVSKSKAPLKKATQSVNETTLSSLSLRLNEPYWLLHRGNCEHFVVVEQMRAIHPSDPRAGYPIMLHRVPQFLDICRACAKSPAVWSIVNDIRLGESPSFLCAPCWANMGVPESSESGPIEIIPLPYHVP